MNIELHNVHTTTPTKGNRRPLLNHLDGNDYVLQIDNTSLETFNTCPRSAYYRLVRGRVTPTSAALQYGSAIHAGLERWYSTVDSDFSDQQREVMMLEDAVADFGDFDSGFNEWRTPDRACDTLQKYIRHYGEEDFDILDDHVETPFSLPLGVVPFDGFVKAEYIDKPIGATPEGLVHVDGIHVYWTGKIDLCVKRQGAHWIVDHKTTSMLGPTFWEHFHLSNQTIGYVWAANQMFGERFAGLGVNCIASRKPTKTGTPTEFHRQYFPYRDDQVEEWETNTMHLVADFLANLRRDYFPMTTAWCMGKYGKCKYHDVCTLPLAQRDSLLYSDIYSDNTWTPLNH